jgi:hypothetical protein
MLAWTGVLTLALLAWPPASAVLTRVWRFPSRSTSSGPVERRQS